MQSFLALPCIAERSRVKVSRSCRETEVAIDSQPPGALPSKFVLSAPCNGFTTTAFCVPGQWIHIPVVATLDVASQVDLILLPLTSIPLVGFWKLLPTFGGCIATNASCSLSGDNNEVVEVCPSDWHCATSSWTFAAVSVVYFLLERLCVRWVDKLQTTVAAS